MSKVKKILFLHVMPACLGVLTGICLRDSQIANVDSKIDMAVANYLEKTAVEPSKLSKSKQLESFLNLNKNDKH